MRVILNLKRLLISCKNCQSDKISLPGSDVKHKCFFLADGLGTEGPRYRHDHQSYRAGSLRHHQTYSKPHTRTLWPSFNGATPPTVKLASRHQILELIGCRLHSLETPLSTPHTDSQGGSLLTLQSGLYLVFNYIFMRRLTWS